MWCVFFEHRWKVPATVTHQEDYASMPQLYIAVCNSYTPYNEHQQCCFTPLLSGFFFTCFCTPKSLVLSYTTRLIDYWEFNNISTVNELYSTNGSNVIFHERGYFHILFTIILFFNINHFLNTVIYREKAFVLTYEYQIFLTQKEYMAQSFNCLK